MKIVDEGFFLGSKKYGETSKIMYVLSRQNGLIKGFTKPTKNNKFSVSNLDKIFFTWKSRTTDGLGFMNFDIKDSSIVNNKLFLLSLIKASAAELCLKLLPLWQKNYEVYVELERLAESSEDSKKKILYDYIIWELNFLKNIGYGFDFNQCAVTGVRENIYFLSPKSGNAVSYSVGKKYEKQLFKIPDFLKNDNSKPNFNQISEALRITSYFFEKNFDQNTKKFIFRSQLIMKVRNLQDSYSTISR